jgi:Cu(I)/Ag(I) efflux system protein CusF
MKAAVLAIAMTTAVVMVHAGDPKEMDVKDMSPSQMAKDASPRKHTAKGIVKSMDPKAQTVTLSHGAVKTLNWPAMTMTFSVHDKAVMDQLTPGKKVEVEFEQHGKDYVITRLK